MTDQIVDAASLQVASDPNPSMLADAVRLLVASDPNPVFQVGATSLHVASPYPAPPQDLVLLEVLVATTGPWTELPAFSVFVWNGATEIPAQAFVWDGASEVTAYVEVF